MAIEYIYIYNYIYTYIYILVCPVYLCFEIRNTYEDLRISPRKVPHTMNGLTGFQKPQSCEIGLMFRNPQESCSQKRQEHFEEFSLTRIPFNTIFFFHQPLFQLDDSEAFRRITSMQGSTGWMWISLDV